MKSQELRSAFVEFFRTRGHKPMPSATLIPDAMSTTLFTIAGMEQFVPAFLGDEPAPADNVVTVQRCLRVAGAKSDIENVGRTGRHGTFLEMLGNFSFGGYGKREAIAYAWEFSTKTMGIDPAKIAVTVHAGDDEAERIWREDVGLPAARITRFEEDNFWTMGSTGPCGPCTELFFDTGAENASGPGDDGPNKGNRWVEFWNVVFQQYDRGSDGKLAPLPKLQIDTGMGFERLLAIVNGKPSMYLTDLFTDVVDAQPPVGSTSLDAKAQTERRNIIADHARAVTFLINDGVYPGNTDRGYVLRFLIRRAIRNGRLLGYPNGFLSELVPAVVASLEAGYPELRANLARIQGALATEEATFDRTLERGIERFESVAEAALAEKSSVIAGRDAFVLHDTYGFPFELTREMADERGLSVDAAAFDEAMTEQRTRARRDAASKRGVVSVAQLPAVKTEFTGYDGLAGEAAIVGIVTAAGPVDSLATGEDAQIVLDRTSFYAEKGGQIGDRGEISTADALFDVADTQFVGEAVAHHGTLRKGRLRVGDAVRTTVHEEWRKEIRRHHTSAHLLQRALKDVLGQDVAQAGSWVGIDRMRFDFRSPSGALTTAQRREVVRRVNEMIRDDSPLETSVMTLEEAKASGAIAMFGEKYGERVRVVTAGPSVEFCGGTHAHSTGELGLFVLLKEESIGSGVRRIESCVSLAAEQFVTHQQDLIGELAGALAASPDELSERVARLQAEVRELQGSLGQIRAQLAAADAARYVGDVERRGDRAFVGAVVRDADAGALKHLVTAVRARMRDGVVAFVGVDGDAVSLIVSAGEDAVRGGAHAGNLVKMAAALVGGRGGGAAAQAQGGGRNAEAAEDALAAIRDAVLASS